MMVGLQAQAQRFGTECDGWATKVDFSGDIQVLI
jgi:hypothetical protein